MYLMFRMARRLPMASGRAYLARSHRRDDWVRFDVGHAPPAPSASTRPRRESNRADSDTGRLRHSRQYLGENGKAELIEGKDVCLGIQQRAGSREVCGRAPTRGHLAGSVLAHILASAHEQIQRFNLGRVRRLLDAALPIVAIRVKILGNDVIVRQRLIERFVSTPDKSIASPQFVQTLVVSAKNAVDARQVTREHLFGLTRWP